MRLLLPLPLPLPLPLQDVATHDAGTLQGLTNSCSILAGIAGNVVTAWLLGAQGGSYRQVRQGGLGGWVGQGDEMAGKGRPSGRPGRRPSRRPGRRPVGGWSCLVPAG